MTTVGFFCNREVVICRPDDSLLEASRRMRDFHVGSIVVVEERQGRRVPVGILTDRDIVIGPVASDHQALDAIRVHEVMSRTLVTARERESLVEGLRRMRAYGVRRMPVVDEAGALQGIIAFDDLLAFFSGELGDLATLLAREQKREDLEFSDSL